MSHTPGPWFVDHSEGLYDFVSAPDPDYPDERLGIAELLNGLHDISSEDAKIVKANARLIAAAPELLAACRELLVFLEFNGIHGMPMIKALSVIVKATGGTS